MKRDLLSFEVAFVALLISSLMLLFFSSSTAEQSFSVVATLFVGVIFLYFKVSEVMKKHHKTG